MVPSTSPFFCSLDHPQRTLLTTLFNQAMVWFKQDTDAVKRDVIGKFTPPLTAAQCNEVFQFLLASGEFGDDNSGSTQTWSIISRSEAVEDRSGFNPPLTGFNSFTVQHDTTNHTAHGLHPIFLEICNSGEGLGCDTSDGCMTPSAQSQIPLSIELQRALCNWSRGADRPPPSFEISAPAFISRCNFWSTEAVISSKAILKVMQLFVQKARLYTTEQFNSAVTAQRFQDIIVWSAEEYYKHTDLRSVTCMVDQNLGCSVIMKALHVQAGDSGDTITGLAFLIYSFRSLFGTPDAGHSSRDIATAEANQAALLRISNMKLPTFDDNFNDDCYASKNLIHALTMRGLISPEALALDKPDINWLDWQSRFAAQFRRALLDAVFSHSSQPATSQPLEQLHIQLPSGDDKVGHLHIEAMLDDPSVVSFVQAASPRPGGLYCPQSMWTVVKESKFTSPALNDLLRFVHQSAPPFDITDLISSNLLRDITYIDATGNRSPQLQAAIKRLDDVLTIVTACCGPSALFCQAVTQQPDTLIALECKISKIFVGLQPELFSQQFQASLSTVGPRCPPVSGIDDWTSSPPRYTGSPLHLSADGQNLDNCLDWMSRQFPSLVADSTHVTLAQQLSMLVDNCMGYDRLAQLGGLTLCTHFLQHLFGQWRTYYMTLILPPAQPTAARQPTDGFITFQEFMNPDVMARLCPCAFAWLQATFHTAHHYAPSAEQTSEAASAALVSIRALIKAPVLPSSPSPLPPADQAVGVSEPRDRQENDSRYCDKSAHETTGFYKWLTRLSTEEYQKLERETQCEHCKVHFLYSSGPPLSCKGHLKGQWTCSDCAAIVATDVCCTQGFPLYKCGTVAPGTKLDRKDMCVPVITAPISVPDPASHGHIQAAAAFFLDNLADQGSLSSPDSLFPDVMTRLAVQGEGGIMQLMVQNEQDHNFAQAMQQSQHDDGHEAWEDEFPNTSILTTAQGLPASPEEHFSSPFQQQFAGSPAHDSPEPVPASSSLLDLATGNLIGLQLAAAYNGQQEHEPFSSYDMDVHSYEMKLALHLSQLPQIGNNKHGVSLKRLRSDPVQAFQALKGAWKKLNCGLHDTAPKDWTSDCFLHVFTEFTHQHKMCFHERNISSPDAQTSFLKNDWVQSIFPEYLRTQLRPEFEHCFGSASLNTSSASAEPCNLCKYLAE